MGSRESTRDIRRLARAVQQVFVLELSYLIQALFALNDPVRGITVNVGTIEGGLSPNVVAPESRAVVDVRVPNPRGCPSRGGGDPRPQVGDAGRDVARGRRHGPSSHGAHPRNRVLLETARRLGKELGLVLEEGVAGGASDGNTTSLFTATLDGLGAVGDGAHARHEFVYTDRMVERCALLALLLMEPPLAERSDPRSPGTSSLPSPVTLTCRRFLSLWSCSPGGSGRRVTTS